VTAFLFGGPVVLAISGWREAINDGEPRLFRTGLLFAFCWIALDLILAATSHVGYAGEG
jgi:hypothetical protein